MKIQRNERQKPRLQQARQHSTEARLGQEITFRCTLHTIQRFKERCVLAKTLDRDAIYAKVLELAAASQPWGIRSDFRRGSSCVYRLIVWGPVRLVLVCVHDQSQEWVVKTVLTEQMAIDALHRKMSAQEADTL